MFCCGRALLTSCTAAHVGPGTGHNASRRSVCRQRRELRALPQARAAAERAEESAAAAEVCLHFLPDDVTTVARPGDSILDAAHAAGVDIVTSCGTGSCGICEMEVRKFAGGPGDGEPIVVRTCIAAVPRGYARLEISQLDDPMWGGDGWDT